MFLCLILKAKQLQSSLSFSARTFSKKVANPLLGLKPKPLTSDEPSAEKLLKDEIFSPEFESKSNPADFSKSDPSEFSKSALVPKNEEAANLPSDLAEAKKKDQEKMKFIRETLLYTGDDPFPERLVERPEKGVVWGLGDFFKKGVTPTPEEVIAFLEIEQAKDITLVDLLKEMGRTDIGRYGIIATTFSARHNYKIAKSLLKAFQKCELPHEGSPPRIHGAKDDEWVMVSFKDLGVHLFVQEARDEVDLEYKWRNPADPEEVMKREKLSLSPRKKGVFEPFSE